jgi:hypothetical protein
MCPGDKTKRRVRGSACVSNTCSLHGRSRHPSGNDRTNGMPDAPEGLAERNAQIAQGTGVRLSGLHAQCRERPSRNRTPLYSLPSSFVSGDTETPGEPSGAQASPRAGEVHMQTTRTATMPDTARLGPGELYDSRPITTLPKEFFPWNMVERVRRNERIQRMRSCGEARAVHLCAARACPTCGTPAGVLHWLYFRSEAWTWEHQCGTAGWLTVCDSCHVQVNYFPEELCAGQRNVGLADLPRRE